jgi:hypothetical protein
MYNERMEKQIIRKLFGAYCIHIECICFVIMYCCTFDILQLANNEITILTFVFLAPYICLFLVTFVNTMEYR